jgi:hypothetical protein
VSGRHYGFMEIPDVQQVARHCCGLGMKAEVENITCYVRARCCCRPVLPGWRNGGHAFSASWAGTRATV